MCFRVVCYVFSVAWNWRGSLLAAFMGCWCTRALPLVGFACVAFWRVGGESIQGLVIAFEVHIGLWKCLGIDGLV